MFGGEQSALLWLVCSIRLCPITSTEQQCQPHPVKQDVDVWRCPVGPQFCRNSHPIFFSMRVPSTSENPGVLVLDGLRILQGDTPPSSKLVYNKYLPYTIVIGVSYAPT